MVDMSQWSWWEQMDFCSFFEDKEGKTIHAVMLKKEKTEIPIKSVANFN